MSILLTRYTLLNQTLFRKTIRSVAVIGNILILLQKRFTALMRASYEGNFKVVATLLAYGADININQKVISLSRLEIVVIRIQPHRIYNTQNGTTALMIASKKFSNLNCNHHKKHLKVMEILVAHGAHVNYTDKVFILYIGSVISFTYI